MKESLPPYGPLATRAEERVLAPIIAQAFDFPVSGHARWIGLAGRENVRVIRDGGRPVGGLVNYPAGQWWGGRSVSTACIAGVAVSPEQRGRGHATRLMQSLIRELAAGGTALSALYPATQPVYRAAGYEQAGTWHIYSTELSTLDRSERDLPVRRMTVRDRALVKRLYDRSVKVESGALDRTPYLWKRVFGEPFGERHGYIVGARGHEEGYLVYMHAKTERSVWDYDLSVQDWAFTTRRAGLRILSFLATHQGQAKFAWWPDGPSTGLLHLDREQWGSLKRRERWMLRIVDVRRALVDRGYSPAVDVDVVLEIEDDVVRRNNGRFRLVVRNGRGRVTKSRDGERSALRLDVRALAPLYSGYVTAAESARTGAVQGSAADLAALDAAFSGPAPWLREHF